MSKKGFFFKHFIYILIGIIVLIFFSSLSKENLFKISSYLFFISLFFLFLVPFLGTEVNGSTRWVNLFFIPRFQPVEIVKPFIIIFISTILCSEKNFHIYFKYLLTFIAIVPACLLLMMQPDIGQTLLIFFAWAILVFISGISLPVILTFFSFSLLSLIYMVFFIPKFAYIKNRILSFFNPIDGTHNFQSDKAIDAISSGGYFGKGIGEGTLKNRVPEAHTDFILAIIGEEFGLFGVSIVIGLFGFLIVRMFGIAKESIQNNKHFAALMAQGIAIWFSIQCTINIAVNLGLFPTKGITLPLLSFGGSSLLVCIIALAIVLRIDHENKRNLRGQHYK